MGAPAAPRSSSPTCPSAWQVGVGACHQQGKGSFKAQRPRCPRSNCCSHERPPRDVTKAERAAVAELLPVPQPQRGGRDPSSLRAFPRGSSFPWDAWLWGGSWEP